MFGISESYANKLYHQQLNILVKVLRLPGKKALLDGELEAIILDVTEQLMERPTKKQRQFYFQTNWFKTFAFRRIAVLTNCLSKYALAVS